MNTLLSLFDPNNPPVFWAAISATTAALVAIGGLIKWLNSHANQDGRTTKKDNITSQKSIFKPRQFRFIKEDTEDPRNSKRIVYSGEGEDMMIQSGKYNANSRTPKWQLLSGKGDRPHEERIDFPTSFKEPPSVIVGLTGLDVDKTENLRVVVEARTPDRNGFTIYFKTWSETKVYGLWIQWIAFGSG